eukprot:TRINITY_DN2570_c0_g1_i3.p1 TRINITY_DN2570_c0_g1~~TRINITY_DN2570_c0_g1_i3.p1  ORF type:complete len:80 (+),score=13.16 TRINITY_DN2570_c0_g1_i3:187-426(+)
MAENPRINVPNLEVLMILKSLESKKLVRKVFNWRFRYYFITDAGISYIREYLGIDDKVVPNPMIPQRKTNKPRTRRPRA